MPLPSPAASPSLTLPQYLRLRPILAHCGTNRALVEDLATTGKVRTIKAKGSRQGSRFYNRMDLEEALDALANGRVPPTRVRRQSSTRATATVGGRG